ncbi:MAG TPA: hypothetical protein PKL54_12185, partial [Candidatus Hydrogenedentes bacterium]|nr:hypothetical protein [Candidatus Hydrogenedentota bacterium]
GDPGDIPYTFSVVFLRGVDDAAFGNPWDEPRVFPQAETLSDTGATAAYTFESHAKPINGDVVFTVLSSPGPLGGASDPHHTALWNAAAPGDGLATVGTLRGCEAGTDDEEMTWTVAAEPRAWNLVMIPLAASGMGELAVTVNADVAGPDALWRIDGGGWRAPDGAANRVRAGWHWMEFAPDPTNRVSRPPVSRWVLVPEGETLAEHGVYTRWGVPAAFYQFLFEGETDYAGVLQLRHVLPPGSTGYGASLSVASLGAPSGTPVLVREGASNTFTKWVQSAESVAAQARTALFFRKQHVVGATTTWRFEYGVPHTVVSGAVTLFSGLELSAIPSSAPFPNTVGGGAVSSPANLLNPLTGATQWDVLFGAVRADGGAAVNRGLTPASMDAAQLWRLGGLTGYTALAAPAGLTTEQQGPTLDTGGVWGGAEAMLTHQTGNVTVTIDPPVLAARPEMRWSIAGGAADYASGGTSVALCGQQQIQAFAPADYKLVNPEELWVEVEYDDTVAATLHYTPILASGLRIYILPEEAAQGGATWRVKGRTPEDTWHGDGYVFTGITAQDLAAGHLEVEFTAASGYGDFSAPPDQTFALEEGTTRNYTVTWRQYGNVNFTVEPPEAAAQNPLWRFAGTETWYTLADTAEAAAGSRTVEFEALDGWRAPVLDVHVPYNDTRTYTVRYESWGTPRLVGQSFWTGETDGSQTQVNIALPQPLPEFSVVAVTWQRDIAAPTIVSLNQVENYTLWASTSSGAARAALFYLKNPSAAAPENRLSVIFGGTGPVFTMQVYCMHFNDVDLDAPLNNIWTGSGAAPTAAHTGQETFPTTADGSLLLDLISVASGDFSPRLDTALHAEDRDLVWAWRGQNESKALLGGGGLVTGKVVTSGTYENQLVWDCVADWGGVMAAVPPARGQLRVNITPPEAVTAGVKWNAQPVYGTGYESGFTRNDVNLGENPLSHNHINGWTPDPAAATTVNVLADVPNTHTYPFVESARGGVRVNIFPAAAVAAGAQWKLTSEASMPWQDGGTVYTDMAQVEKNYIIEYNDPAGWTPPARQNVWVKEGEITEVSVMFTQAGALRVSLERDGAPMAGDFW